MDMVWGIADYDIRLVIGGLGIYEVLDKEVRHKTSCLEVLIDKKTDERSAIKCSVASGITDIIS